MIKVPEISLRPYVKYIWLYENVPGQHKNDILTFAVDGYPMLIFHYKKPIRCSTGNNLWNNHPRQCVVGQIKSYGNIVESDQVGMIAVIFYPDGLYPLLKIPMDYLTEKIIDLRDILGHEALELSEQIEELSSGESKIAAIQEYLHKKLKDHIDYKTTPIRHAISWMQQNRNVVVQEIANEINMSNRNFERKFLEQVGLSPVFFNRIVRFQRSLKLISSANFKTYTDIAYYAGYYDQSHFIRDFKLFFGCTPQAFSTTRNFG